MDIKIIATLMTFILGTLIILSRSWSRRERHAHNLEARYAQELMKNRGRPVGELDGLLSASELKEIALDLARARGRDQLSALEVLRSDLLHVLAK